MKSPIGRGLAALVMASAAATVLAAPALSAPAAAKATPFTLANGMQVVVIEDHRAPVVTHMVWFRVGGSDDPPGLSGAAGTFDEEREALLLRYVEGLSVREIAVLMKRTEKAVESLLSRAKAKPREFLLRLLGGEGPR